MGLYLGTQEVSSLELGLGVKLTGSLEAQTISFY